MPYQHQNKGGKPMDDLQFRRQAYGDPNDQSDEFLTHLASHPEDAKLVNELKMLDEKLSSPLHIDVPEDLSEKLILRQQLSQHKQQQKRTRYLMAMAASVAFVVGLSFSMLRFTPVDLSAYALEHVYHEPNALTSNQDIGFNDVNFKLASMSGLEQSKFISQPGKVLYTAYCNFQGVRSLHLVMQDENGQKVTLFIVPAEARLKVEDNFGDQQLVGQSFKAADAYMLLVGDKNADLEFVKSEVKNTFI